MTELSEQQIQHKAVIDCNGCKTRFVANSIDHFCFDEEGNCQTCQAEIIRSLTDLIRAARDLRQASADYTNGSDKGEIHYADAIHESVDLLIDALDNYEGGGKR